MAQVPNKLIVIFSGSSIRELAKIWEWNANSHGERHASTYVNFLRVETRKLARSESAGRVVAANPTLRYHTIKCRSGAYGHVMIFQIDGDILYILHYFHTSQDWENSLSDEADSGGIT